MKYWSILFLNLLFTFSNNILGQSQQELDSLRKVASSENDTIAAKALLNIAQAQENIDSAIYYSDKALLRIEDVEDTYQKAFFYNKHAVIVSYSGNNDLALNFYLKALRLIDTNTDSKGQFLKQDILGNIGGVYYDLKDYLKALDYSKKALLIAEENNFEEVYAICWMRVGLCEIGLERYADAIKNLKLSLDIIENSEDKTFIDFAYVNVGEAYLHNNDLDSAEVYFNKSLRYRENKGDVPNPTTILNLAQIKLKKKNYGEALQLAQQSLKISDDAQLGIKKLEALELIYQIHEASKDYEKAFFAFADYIELKDSIGSQETIQRIEELQTQYETEKKEKENQILKQENEIQNLELNQARSQITFFIILIVLAGILIVVLFIFYRTNRRNAIQLKALNATKDKLFAIVAHDLKNPLSAFRSITQSLSENLQELDKGEINYFLEKINKSSTQLYDLLQNLLQWAVNETGELTYSPKETNIQPIVEMVKNQLQSSAYVKNITLGNKLAENSLAVADAKMVEIVLRNLISNAIKFTPDGGNINIFAKNETSLLKISVQDNGIGISPEDQKKLFHIEQDTSNIGNSPNKGIGLGLILCKELVQKHGGTIVVESQLEKGSTFSFTLPLS